MPLDTHVHRISRYIKLTSRKQADWRTAVEITDVYGREEAHEVIRRSQLDYENSYGHIKAAKARLARL